MVHCHFFTCTVKKCTGWMNTDAALALPVKPSLQDSPQTEAAVDKEDPVFFLLSVFFSC